MQKMLEAAALKDIDARPHQFETRTIAEHLFKPRDDALQFSFFDGIGIDAELEVEAENAVRLPVHQCRVAGVEGRVKPEPALVSKLEIGAYVGDEKPVLECPSQAFEAKDVADRAARAVGGDDPIGLNGLDAVWRRDRNRDMAGVPFEPGDAVVPGDARMADGKKPLDQGRLEFALRKIDKRRMREARFRLEIEAKELLGAMIDATHLPSDAALNELPTDAKPAQNLKRAPRPANGSTPDGGAITFVNDQNVFDATKDEIDGRG
jgi:hypothetical protein